MSPTATRSQVQVQTRGSWFEKLCPTDLTGVCEYPYRLRVVVAGPRITPRHPLFEYFLEMGVAYLPAILRHTRLKIIHGANLLFVLPERSLSVHEQHAFLNRLSKHPQARDICSVDIVTQNPLIVGSVPSGCLGKFDIGKDDPVAGLLDIEMH